MKRVKVNSLILLLLLTASNISFAQNKIIKSKDYRIRLAYKKKQLKAFYCINLKKPFHKRYFHRFKFKVEWRDGEVQVFGHNLEYSYRYDTLYRVFEASMYTEWSNHAHHHYMYRKYDSYELEPKECFYYAKLNYPYEKKVEYDCREEIDWTNVIEHELRERSRFYPKSSVKMDIIRFLEPDAKDEFINFLYDLNR